MSELPFFARYMGGGGSTWGGVMGVIFNDIDPSFKAQKAGKGCQADIICTACDLAVTITSQ